MNPKILVLAVVSVLAVAPEFTKAAVPAFCNEAPSLAYSDEPSTEKWAWSAKQNKCRKFLWGFDAKARNHFDTEAACVATCKPATSQAEKPWIVVGGRCLCRCPKCEIHDATAKTKRNMTPKPKVVPEVTTSTTEESLLKSFFNQKL